jgi:subtilisin family serine protease
MRVRFGLLIGLLGLALFALTAAGALSADSTQTFIVQMRLDPVVAYKGDISGLAATKPATGKKIDPTSSKVVKYVGYLTGKHDEALSKVGGGQKLYDYVYSFNGFAAKLTDGQAAGLQGRKDVVAVTPDELQTIDTSSTPHFLGLDDPGGLWDQLGGPTGGKNNSGAGEGMIIGDVDSGIWPESKSFSDRDVNGKLIYKQIPGWHGKCTPGEDFKASNCNQKLIGAQWFDAGWGGDAGVEAQRPWEFTSARDYNSHGTHTASTAGGNHGVQPTGDAAAFTPISGMAPRARVAAYKALFSTQDASTASGFNSDIVEAIDTAVADGVDVINYSVGPSAAPTTFLSPEQVAFLFAADAGVFVSAAGGNAGPGASSVVNPGPWVTTVAAGTHNRTGQGSVTIDGTTYTGASLAPAETTGTLVDAQESALAGQSATAARLCFGAADNAGQAVLDPAKVSGKIVLCDRGSNALVNKSLAVKQAGGIGMVLTNVSGGSTTLNALLHSVPTVHVPYTATNYAALHTAAHNGSTATIAKATLVFNVPAPTTASFSGRGPALAGGGDLLKPDVMAPGVDILAAVSPAGDNGRNFDLFQGTSMSTPHVAGVAALLMQLHPSWSPMAIKSALMTSAYDVLDGPGTSPSVIFSEGAGHIKPNSAADPGLVYDNGFNDWLAFLCGTSGGVSASTCNALHGLGYSLDPSDLNVPSIAIGDLVGAQTVTRKVTNVGKTAATYNASVTGMAGITVDVSPSSLSLNPGQTKSFTVAFTRGTAALSTYTGGRLAWSDGNHNVRIPLVVRPVAIVAPLEVTGAASGISYSVKTGYAGTLNFAARGLVPATTTAASVAQDPDQTFNPAVATGTYSKDVVVPAGLKLFRIGIDESSITPSGTDLDVYVYRGGSLVGLSADGDSNEMVTFTNPPAGTYTVYVHGFNTVAPSANFTLYEWQLGSASAGNMTVPAPAAATIGGTVPVNLSFTGRAAGTWYLGQVVYNDGSTDIGTTIVNVK